MLQKIPTSKVNQKMKGFYKCLMKKKMHSNNKQSYSRKNLTSKQASSTEYEDHIEELETAISASNLPEAVLHLLRYKVELHNLISKPKMILWHLEILNKTSLKNKFY